MKQTAPAFPLYFEYRFQARRPALYAALGAGIIAGYAAAIADATLALPAVGAYIGLVLWRLWRNPAAGLRFSARDLEVFDPQEARRFALREIRSARIGTGLLCEGICVLTLRDGTRLALPPDALPPLAKLRLEFARHGIETR